MPAESRLPDEDLHRRVRDLIEERQLPIMLRPDLGAAHGVGALCCACEQPITLNQVEYQVEDHRDGNLLSFHFDCYGVWQMECAEQATLQPDNHRPA